MQISSVQLYILILKIVTCLSKGEKKFKNLKKKIIKKQFEVFATN